MGIIFGITGTKGPTYDILYKTSTYEIRSYGQGFLTAEVPYENKNGNEGFRILAKYIGVFGNPANEEIKSMVMTHPVLIDESKPDQNGKEVMKFVLPAQYIHIQDAPKPTDHRVVLRENSPQYIASIGFSGWYTPETGLLQLQKLSHSLQIDHFIPNEKKEDLIWSVAQYHPPFTIPFLRLNEIWIKLDPEQSVALKELLQKIKK